MINFKTINWIYIVFSALLIFVYCGQVLSFINETINDLGNYNQGIYRLALLGLWLLNVTFILINFKLLISSFNNQLIRISILLIFLLFSFHIISPDPSMTIGTAGFRLLSISLPLLVFICSFLIFKRSDFGIVLPKLFLLVFLGLLIMYFSQYNLIIAALDVENKAYNSAYILMFCLPLLLCINKRWIRILIMILIGAVIFSSNKRGGFVGYGLALVGYYFISSYLKDNTFNLKKIIYLGILLLVVWMGFTYYDNQKDGFFLYRLEKLKTDGGSGRFQIYTDVIDNYLNSSLGQLLFGHGDNAVSYITFEQVSAHNDYLEVLYNYGLIMLSIVIVFFYKIYKMSKKIARHKARYAAPMTVSVLLFFIFSMISHVFIYQYFILLTLFWGMVIGSFERETSKKQVSQDLLNKVNEVG